MWRDSDDELWKEINEWVWQRIKRKKKRNEWGGEMIWKCFVFRVWSLRALGDSGWKELKNCESWKIFKIENTFKPVFFKIFILISISFEKHYKIEKKYIFVCLYLAITKNFFYFPIHLFLMSKLNKILWKKNFTKYKLIPN